MDYRNNLLLASAARLYSLGVDLEAAREQLRQLVEQDVSYQSEEMRQAYRNFKELEQKWNDLEQQHIELRDKIVEK